VAGREPLEVVVWRALLALHALETVALVPLADVTLD
jgi:hypothetical protein